MKISESKFTAIRHLVQLQLSFEAQPGKRDWAMSDIDAGSHDKL